jgi:proteasome lid subunit RPN8/RPN11
MDNRPNIRLAPANRTLPVPTVAPLKDALRWEPEEQDVSRPEVTVFMTQPAYARIHVHAASDLDNEVGGILVGKWCLDKASETRFIVIEKVLPALYTEHSGVHLTFTQDSIVHYHEVIDQRYMGKLIVGWYHTHPHMGVFLSDYDTWLHNHFFNEPWQVALVVEPCYCLGGFFIRQTEGNLDSTRYFGFYEMNGKRGRSCVHWQNLSPHGDESE